MENIRHKIVLVDDNIATLNQGKSLLQDHYSVFTVQSSALLFDYLEHDKPDLILLDVEMPGTDGFDTIKKLKSDLRYKDIPVIFLTGKSDEASERKGFLLGAVDYIAKPLSGPLLQKRISNQILYMRVQNAVKDYSNNLETMTEMITKANERAKLLLDKMPFSCRLFDKDRKVIECNEAAVKLFGFKNKQECMDKTLDIYPDFQPDGQRSKDKLGQMVDKVLDEGDCTMEWTYKLPDGKIMPAEVTCVRIEYDGSFVAAVYTRDLSEHKAIITEKQRAELAEMANLAKTQFLAMMSHELRTPMNSITGFAELALDMPENSIPPKVREYLKKILESTRWFLRIANDILDISKIESGKMELEKIPFDLHDVFSRCQSVILPEAVEKGLDYRVYLEPVTDASGKGGINLIGDPMRLYQALTNLLSNAIKFTDSGIVNLSSVVRKAEDNFVIIYFEIKDTGIGMDEKLIEKLFEPFTQADTSTTRLYGGAGLGLAITKNIIEQMGGKLSVKSSCGKGSTFSFEIKFETVKASAESSGSIKDEPKEKPVFNAEILVCDDNLLNQEVICEHLARVGIKATVADNGSVAVQKVRERAEKGEKPFDLIFMDIFMPVMDGIEAASEIISAGSKTPIVAMTANIMISEIKKYSKHGMPDCLNKPFTTRQLWSLLQKYLVPVKFESVINNDNDEDLIKRLKINFVKHNQSLYESITEAIRCGDIILAHRLVHTLKGNAGHIRKPELKKTAEQAEILLKDGTIPNNGIMEALKIELDKVLSDLKPLLDEPHAAHSPLNSEEIKELFKKLEIMLKQRNADCEDLLDEIRAVPGAEELARQIEEYDFKLAEITLDKLKTQLKI